MNHQDVNYSKTIKVIDRHGFIHESLIKYQPNFGFATAYYTAHIIGTCQLRKLIQPHSDLDIEWEQYQEQLENWKDEIDYNIKIMCTDYFNANFGNN